MISDAHRDGTLFFCKKLTIEMISDAHRDGTLSTLKFLLTLP